jgi:hypothetical protein
MSGFNFQEIEYVIPDERDKAEAFQIFALELLNLYNLWVKGASSDTTAGLKKGSARVVAYQEDKIRVEKMALTIDEWFGGFATELLNLVVVALENNQALEASTMIGRAISQARIKMIEISN